MRNAIVTSLILALMLSACAAPKSLRPTVDPGLVEREAAKQRELAVRIELERVERLNRVALPILARNAELCGERVTDYLGFRAGTLPDVDKKDFRPAYATLFGLDDRLRIVQVTPGSPAAAAGLRVGDVIAGLNGTPAPSGEGAGKKYQEQLAAELKKGGGISFDVERQGSALPVQVTPARVCAFPMVLDNKDIVNALADGEKIMVTTGMLRFCERDEELAVVLGHELGHNVMDHIKAKKANMAGGLALDILVILLTGVNPQFTRAAALAYSVDFESEADYVGLYYTARAGYPIDNAPDIWRKMAIEHPEAIGKETTHPAMAQRFVALEAARDEIKRKIAEGRDLTPEMKKDADAPKPEDKAGQNVAEAPAGMSAK
jgi:hypothetical protein